MKRFLKKVFFFMLPVILFLSIVEYLLRAIPNDYSLKYERYTKYGGDFETLILGNSYAYYDLDPAFFRSNTFNGAHLAQSLDLDDAIFRKFESRLTKLKQVIIPISDISFYFRMKHSEVDWRLTYYSIYYKLPTTFRPADYFEIFHLPFSVNRNRLIAYYWKKVNPVTSTPLGFGSDYRSSSKQDLDLTAMEARKLHTVRDDDDFATEKRSLESIIETCQKRNIRVLLFIPPAYSGYVSTIGSPQLDTTIRTCQSFADKYKNVSFFNFLEDRSFGRDDYFDAVHLNEIGAKKLSLRIDSMIHATPASPF